MSDIFVVSHEEAGESGFAPLAIGEYECVITGAEATQSGAGNPMIKVTLTVRDDIEQEGKKRKFFDNVVFQENTKWKYQQVFKALGFENGKSFDGGLPGVAKEMLYKPVRIKNKHEDYKGKPQDRVDFYTNTHNPGVFAATEGGDPFQGARDVVINDDDLPF